MRSVYPFAGSQETGVRSQETPDPILMLAEESAFYGRRQPARKFEDLIVWQRAHAWVLDIYRFTETFPSKETYSLTSQFRRAAFSIPANIAEGFKKTGVADKRRFMNTAQGSLEECRYYLILARDLGYGETAGLSANLEEVSRLLHAYARAIETPGS